MTYLLIAGLAGLAGIVVGWMGCSLCTVAGRTDAWHEGYLAGRAAPTGSALVDNPDFEEVPGTDISANWYTAPEAS